MKHSIRHNGEVIYPYSRKKFIKLYVNEMNTIFNLNNSQQKVLSILLSNVKKDTNHIDISPQLRKEFAAELEISIDRFNHILTSILKHEKQIIVRGGRGRYIINPTIAYNGKYDNLAKIYFIKSIETIDDTIAISQSIIVNGKDYVMNVEALINEFENNNESSIKDNNNNNN